MASALGVLRIVDFEWERFGMGELMRSGVCWGFRLPFCSLAIFIFRISRPKISGIRLLQGCCACKILIPGILRTKSLN